jgi:hypothetical protein
MGVLLDDLSETVRVLMMASGKERQSADMWVFWLRERMRESKKVELKEIPKGV